MKKFFSLAKQFVEETNKLLFFLITAASIFGILMVHSTTRWLLEDGQSIQRDAVVMIIAAVAGIIIALVISAIDYELVTKLWPIIGVVCVVLMIITLVFGAAPIERPDSKCWLKFGSVYFQTSELVKIGFIISFGVHLEKLKNNINHLYFDFSSG